MQSFARVVGFRQILSGGDVGAHVDEALYR